MLSELQEEHRDHTKREGISFDRIWRVVKDGKTRDSHLRADGQKVGMNEPFLVDGEVLFLPSDPNGSPENTFNCRCFVEYVEKPMVINLWSGRRQSIIDDTEAIFEVAMNPDADGSEPLHAIRSQSQVAEFDGLIVAESGSQQVNPDLVRAIMYIETTQGWYDAFIPSEKSLRPMNIHTEFWKGLGWSREELQDPAVNIRAGVTLLKRIVDRLEDPTVEKVATIYNSIGRERISDYGARVGVIFRGRLWEESQEEE